MRLYLYQIINLVNGKKYIGLTNDPDHRWSCHRTGSGSRLVAAAIRKYGLDQFEFELISCGSDWYIIQAEILLIRAYNTRPPHGYNLSEGGSGNQGMKYSMETKKKMSDSQKARHKAHPQKHSFETITKMRELQSNRHWSTWTKSITLDSHEYPSITEAANRLGISERCLRMRIKRQRDRGITDLLSNPPRRKGHINQGVREAMSKPITVDGIEYPSLKQAAFDLNIKEPTLQGRVRRQRQRGINENCLESCPKHLPCGGASPNYSLS